jgi:hypothetical protein
MVRSIRCCEAPGERAVHLYVQVSLLVFRTRQGRRAGGQVGRHRVGDGVERLEGSGMGRMSSNLDHRHDVWYQKRGREGQEEYCGR